MTSILATQPLAILMNGFTAQMDVPAVVQIQDPILGHRSEMEGEEKNRGRHRARGIPEGSEEPADTPVEGADGNSSGADGPSRKRRRSRKGLGKKFECPHEDCRKSYSRAEHLYRHQLNHTPKQIFSCDFPGCARTFVRQDLCNRHRDRHTAKGSQLHRKDSMLGHPSTMVDMGKPLSFQISSSTEEARSHISAITSRPIQLQYQSPQEVDSNSYTLVTHSNTRAFASRTHSHGAEAYLAADAFKRANSGSFARGHEPVISGPSTRTPRHASFGVTDSKPVELAQTSLQTSRLNSPPSGSYSNSLNSPQHFVTQPNLAPFSLPPPGFSAPGAASSSNQDPEMLPTPIPVDFMKDSSQHQQADPDMMLLDQMTEPTTLPVFGGECHNRSPFAIPEDLVAYLFSGQQLELSSQGTQGAQRFQTNYSDVQYYGPSFGNEMNLGGFFPPGTQQQHHPMALTSLLDTSLPGTVISEEKSQSIIDLIRERFNETGHAPSAKQKDDFLQGDRSDDSHMLSRKMMQIYIASYWYHFSEQVPILHKPTFSPDETPNLLLMAIMAIGAGCLPRKHDPKVTEAGAELSNFLAWHLRWEIFSHNHFRPPAKLWIFQALLLLEVYEKMFSTRALHERAHIHHATTITLMRRGSSLIGRSALDSPPSIRDEKQGQNSSRQSSASGVNTPSEWWNHWIINEATRRAAFAAFVIDSTHATMFGHSTVMVAHEMRLPLPCDDTLWYATNGAEVGRLESSLHASGAKPISFLEGLKRTLNAQEVRTSSFGRTILMAGLLSVSWHMNQRDLQVNSLGVSQALGGRDKWRGSLTRAFDLWKQDFDRSLVRQTDSIPGPYLFSEKKGEDTVFQGRTVHHHLAHMAMHVDIVDCQIFARAKRLLGRSIGSQDLNSAQRRMKEIWAPTAKARDATWYALRFLRTVLLPDEEATASTQTDQDASNLVFDYSARDDILLNRPWVMYFAALIVWSYGYALEGPTTAPLPGSHDFDDQVQHMREYLRRLGGAGSPEELKSLRGFNGCSGMLMVLRTIFEKTRWQLLHEAAVLLENCVELLRS